MDEALNHVLLPGWLRATSRQPRVAWRHAKPLSVHKGDPFDALHAAIARREEGNNRYLSITDDCFFDQQNTSSMLCMHLMLILPRCEPGYHLA